MSWREKAKRFKFQVKQFEDLSYQYRNNPSPGKKATLTREMTFLQSKIEASFRDISNEVNPAHLFRVVLKDGDSHLETIFNLGSRQEVLDYVEFLNYYRTRPYTVVEVMELNTRFTY